MVEAIVILPRNMFYTTDISVTLWILNKNKKARTVQLPDAVRNYRDRQHEILFLDLREKGIPFEKKYTQFSILFKNTQITNIYFAFFLDNDK